MDISRRLNHRLLAERAVPPPPPYKCEPRITLLGTRLFPPASRGTTFTVTGRMSTYSAAPLFANNVFQAITDLSIIVSFKVKL